MAEKQRCAWAQAHALLRTYHDSEWGVPLHDDRQLFEMLNLEGAQAGLSWLTILARREGYQEAFDHFVAQKIAQYNDAKRVALLQDARIIRNRLKINAVIENAKAFLEVQQAFGSFNDYLWQFVAGRHLTHVDQLPAIEISKKFSKDLKRRGFRFVGPTTCLAFMQAVGMVNDHEPSCFRFSELESLYF